MYVCPMKSLVCLLLVGALALPACKTSQKTNTNTDAPQETLTAFSKEEQDAAKGVWKFEGKNAFSLKETVAVKMYHQEATALLLHRPMEMLLEVEEGGKWRAVRKLYCPCLQDCPAPPKEKEVAANEKVEFSWTPQEEWCESGAKNAPAPLGKYRLVVYHRANSEKKMAIQHFLFTLKK